eukprot:Skav205417  [mRNA]  locus=scaffold582:128301:132893:- [translate_table: standard]
MDYGIRLHNEGRYQGLPDYEPSLMKLQLGARVTLVATIGHRDPVLGHLCQGILTGQKFRLRGVVPDSCNKVTILNGVVSHFRTPIVEVDQYADMLFHHARPLSSLFDLVETCGGLGALGNGAKYAGWRTRAYNDIAETFCEHMRQNSSVPVIQGDICKLETMAALHKAAPDAGAMGFGFSCQPFSTLGDQRHGDDLRANTLPYGLYCAYLLQMDLVVLECVPNASTSAWVQRCLQQYQQAVKADRAEILLDLFDFWPSKRRRWWSVITPCFLGRTLLMPFPKMQGLPSVSCLLPHAMELTPEEIEELTLTQDERRQFDMYGKGVQSQVVDFQAALPTALHSWGNQCVPCSCGCRNALSENRLREHGLHGALMYVPDRPAGKDIRHIAAKEVCVLVGFPKKEGWCANQRLLLAGVGQLASPLQSCWIFGHLRNQLVDSQLTQLPACSPSEILSNVIADVLELRDRWCPDYVTVPMQVYESNLEKLLGYTITKTPEADEVQPMLEDQPAADDGARTPQPESREEPTMSHENPAPMGHESTTDEPMAEVPTSREAPVDPPAPAPARASQPVDQATGAVAAFASDSSPVVRSATMPVEIEDSPSQNTEQVDMLAHDDAITPTAPMIASNAHEVAQDILAGKAVLVDVTEAQVTMLPHHDSMTVDDFLQAERQLEPGDVYLYNCLGRMLRSDESLNQFKLLIRSSSPLGLPLEIQEVIHANHSRTRQNALLHQGSAVAVDEMQFYMSGMQATQDSTVVQPAVIHDLTDVPSELYHWWEQVRQSQCTKVATAMLFNHHWVPYVITIDPAERDGSMQLLTTEEGAALWKFLSPHLHGTAPTVVVSDPVPKSFYWDCGFQTFAWLMAQVQGQKIEPMTIQRACDWRFLFWQKLLTCPQLTTGYMPLGGHPDAETAVAMMLREHGVFPDRAVDRAKSVIQMIGMPQIVQLLNGPKPWQALKDRANKQTPRVRLILEDEFATMVKGRKNKMVATTKAPHGNKSNHGPIQVTPADVAIPEGVFRQADGAVVAQLQPRQINPACKGVVVLTEQEFHPWKANTAVTKEGLGFLIPVPCSKELEELGCLVRFPVQSVASGEPMLMSAILVQRGQKEIARCTPQTQVQVEQIPTQTIKVMLYRDQCPVAWEHVVDKPVRQVLELLPCLKVCKQSACKCPAWHQEDSGHEPLLDVWQRDFLNAHFKRTKQSEAAIFVCMMRITEAAFAILQASSGTAGVFIEGRSHDGKTQDPKQHTVWLPKMSYEEARAAQSRVEEDTCLIRVSYRYGLRTAQHQAKAVHAKFRPSEPFLGASSKSTWVVGPMPWGTTRQALIKLFSTWNWNAKPLQTADVAADRSGLKWHVLAESAPPNYVYNMSHGDVLIVQEQPQANSHAVHTRVEASTKTQRLMQPSPGNRALHEDPWAESATKLPHVQAQQQLNLASIEAAVEAKVLAKLQRPDEDQKMEVEVETRLSTLEAQMVSMQQDQQAHKQQTNTLQATVDHLGQQIDNTGTKLQQHFDQQMHAQMERIEALLDPQRREVRPRKD